jgi:outer membrane lipoprotein-sorting protein
MDANMTYESRTSTLKMTVEGKRRTRVFEMISYGRGQTDTAMEYKLPARDKGTKMLKIGDDLWLYLPAVDRTQKISGHMLRQGMMGSDLSYEDMMAAKQMEDQYKSTVLGSDTVDGRDCWKLEMVAKDNSVSYPKRVSWIDKQYFIPLKQELYALSGMLLKTWLMSDIQPFKGGRHFPMKMVIEDRVKKGSRTILEFSDLTFGVELPREVFSRRWLERK